MVLKNKIRIALEAAKILLFLFVVNSFFVSKSFANTSFKPFYSIASELDITSLKNDMYNMSDGFGKDSEIGYGLGIGVGIRGDSDNGLYVAGEISVNADRLFDKEASQITGTEHDRQEISIYSIFNAKLNVGYSFNVLNNNSNNYKGKLTMFTSIGLKHIEYESTHEYNDYSGVNQSGFRRFNDYVITPTFGIGAGYFISKRFEARLSYEYSSFKIEDGIFEFPSTEGKVTVKVNTFRLGFNYIF